MTLPTIQSPVFSGTLPSGQDFKFRPFTVKEQKNLLIVAEGGKDKDVISGIVDLVNNCTYNKIDWLKEPTVNLEYAFLHIRSKSVGEIVEITYLCKAEKGEGDVCNHKNFLEIDVREANSEKFPEAIIKITDVISIVLEQLTVKDTLDILDGSSVEKLIHKKIKMVMNGTETITEFSQEELAVFLDSLPIAGSLKLNAFFAEQPTLVLRPDTKCVKCGEQSFIEIKGVLNFFG
jgi:T4 bacteriophage base plate protein